MEGYFVKAITFLMDVIFGVYIIILMLRFLFQWVHANFYNPLSQAIVMVTNPVLIPLRRVIPSWSGYDLSCLTLMLVLQMLELVVVIGFKVQQMPSLLGVLVLAIAHLMSLFVYVFLFAIIIEVIFSWVAMASGGQMQRHNPLMELVYALTKPLMEPIRKMIPPLGGVLDLSPIVALIGLQLTLILLVAPISDLGVRLL